MFDLTLKIFYLQNESILYLFQSYTTTLHDAGLLDIFDKKDGVFRYCITFNKRRQVGLQKDES